MIREAAEAISQMWVNKFRSSIPDGRYVERTKEKEKKKNDSRSCFGLLGLLALGGLSALRRRGYRNRLRRSGNGSRRTSDARRASHWHL